MLGSNRVYNQMSKFKNVIKDIDRFEIEIKDSLGRDVYMGDKNYIIEISIKGFGVIDKVIDNSENVIEENTLYEQINNLLSS